MSERNSAPYWVYILQCRDGTLYTGITTDVPRRVAQHNAGTGAKYTRSRRPVKVVYQERCADKSAALRREHTIKTMHREAKLKMIQSASEDFF